MIFLNRMVIVNNSIYQKVKVKKNTSCTKRLVVLLKMSTKI